jgi:hypothetical protein
MLPLYRLAASRESTQQDCGRAMKVSKLDLTPPT